jgi:hypothetical protein
LVNFRAIQDKIKHEKLLEYCLEINDDINKTFARYDNLKMGKGKGSYSPSHTIHVYIMKGKDDIVVTNLNKTGGSNFKKEDKGFFSDSNKESSSNKIETKNQGSTNLIDFFDTNPVTTTTTTSNQPKGNEIFDIFSNQPVVTNTSNTNVVNMNNSNPNTFFNVGTTNNMNSGMGMPNTAPQKKEVNLNDLLKQAYTNNIQTNVNENTNVTYNLTF